MADLYETMLNLLSIYRHDFLNHLQVIGGLTQLNKTEKIPHFVYKASEEINQFGRLAACGNPYLALLIYESLYKDQDIIALLEVKHCLSDISADILECLAEVLALLRENLKMAGCKKLTITLNGEDCSLSLLISGKLDGTSFWHPITESCKGGGLPYQVDLQENKLTMILK